MGSERNGVGKRERDEEERRKRKKESGRLILSKSGDYIS